MMKKRLILVVLMISFIFINGCISQEEKISKGLAEGTEKVEVPGTITSTGLGNLCFGEEECVNFCLNNRGRCEDYCKGKQNELCESIFPIEPWKQPQQQQQKTDPARSGCTGSGTVEFTSPPMRIEEIEIILPIGLMIGGHVTPIDHGYYTSLDWKPEYRDDPTKYKDVLAPADGVIGDIGHMPGAKEGQDYRLYIYHTCTFYTIYIHLWKLSPELAQALGSSSYKVVNVPVKSGEVIGRSGGFDFSVHNDELILEGFIIPEHYVAESWKIHTDNIFDHFVEPIKSQLLDKNVRQKEPRGGKIDYDIDGKLVGNWFVENTNGYAGVTDRPGDYGYWSTHLAFAYDGLDPSLIIVSIGDYNGEAKQFAVKGNKPDPATVSTDSGLVKYELVAFGYKTEEGKDWDRVSFAKISKAYGFDEHVAGAVLVQMIEDRKIKFEAFPDKTASQITGFTNNAKIYER